MPASLPVERFSHRHVTKPFRQHLTQGELDIAFGPALRMVTMSIQSPLASNSHAMNSLAQRTVSSEENCAALVEMTRQWLAELAGVVHALSDTQYASRPVAPFTGSIGAHVRHSLDHLTQLLLSVGTRDVLDYDRRVRGTNVEFERQSALELIQTSIQNLASLAHLPAEHPIQLVGCVDVAGPIVSVRSTLGRELIFLLSHTVHHNALIALMAAAHGVRTPDHFGWAPATIRASKGH